MTLPATHGGGGGRQAPPIAGDPASFPSDAELARTLVANQRTATLSTLTAAGYPYGSLVTYAADDTGAPVFLVSELAEHTVNARRDDRVSLLVTGEAPDGDPLGHARLTLVGKIVLLEEPGEAREVYLDRHPYASSYADFSDFHFWRLDVEDCRYIGGFGHMSWTGGDGYRGAGVDPVAEGAPGAIAHMNEDHADANLAYVRGLTELVDATEATLVGLDRYGLTLRAATPGGPRMARVPFPDPLTAAKEVRPAVIDLLATARAAASTESPAS